MCTGFSLPLGVLAWLYLVVLWLAWTPIRENPPEILWTPPDAWVPFLGNLLLLAPLGFVQAVHRGAGVRLVGRLDVGRVALRVALAAAMLSAVVELGQFRVPGRHVSPWDVVLNTFGAALAAWYGARLVTSGFEAPRLVGAAMGLVFSGVLLFQVATGFTASRMLTLSDWNEEYPVFAGDEPTGARAYNGDLSEARICSASSGRTVCVGPGAPLEERIALSQSAQVGQSAGLAAVVRSAGPQTGDARIVTFSMDHLHRNATLYQEERDLLLRLRTPLGGPNGTGLEFVLPEAVPDGVPTRVLGSFQVGRIEMAAGEGAVRAVFPIGIFSGWWLVRRLPENRVEAGMLRRAMLVSAAAFSLPLGLAAVLFLPWGPALAGPVAGGLAASVLIVLLASVLRIPVSLWDVAAASGFGVVGGILGLAGRRATAAMVGKEPARDA